MLKSSFRTCFGRPDLRGSKTRGMMFELPDEVKTNKTSESDDWRVSQAVKGS